MYYTTRHLQQLFFDEVQEAKNISRIRELSQQKQPCFRYFHEAILFFVKEKGYQKDHGRIKAIYNKAKSKHIIMKEETISNWFKGISIAKRESLYKLAFTLDLTIDEVIYLFEHVCFERAFDFKNPKEIIYYYCFRYGYDYIKATCLFDFYQKQRTKKPITYMDTIRMKEEVIKIEDDETLMTYLLHHEGCFLARYVTSRKYINDLLMQIRGNKQDELLWEQMKIHEQKEPYLSQMSIVMQDYLSQNQVDELTRKIDSDQFLIETLMGMNSEEFTNRLTYLRKRHAHKVKTYIDYSLLSLFEGFMDRQILSEVLNDTYVNDQRMRHLLILLYFYLYCVQEEIHTMNGEQRYQDFVINMNEILEICGHQPLFVGNIYDWFFLYCVYQKEPLITFRKEIRQLLFYYDIKASGSIVYQDCFHKLCKVKYTIDLYFYINQDGEYESVKYEQLKYDQTVRLQLEQIAIDDMDEEKIQVQLLFSDFEKRYESRIVLNR